MYNMYIPTTWVKTNSHSVAPIFLWVQHIYFKICFSTLPMYMRMQFFRNFTNFTKTTPADSCTPLHMVRRYPAVLQVRHHISLSIPPSVTMAWTLHLTLLAAVITAVSANCPGYEWTQFRDMCYWGRSDFTLHWDEVADVCNLIYPGAEMVIIHDIALNTFIAEYIAGSSWQL